MKVRKNVPEKPLVVLCVSEMHMQYIVVALLGIVFVSAETLVSKPFVPPVKFSADDCVWKWYNQVSSVSLNLLYMHPCC
jgi:hypothetical protein